ncbi:MAG: S8 family serine peptidase [Bacteroidota bacterium]
MKKIIAGLTVILCGMQLFPQTAPNKYWVQFTDKQNSVYSTDRPDEFLSARSIERRERYSIVVSEQDLPVSQAYIDSLTSIGVTVLNRSKWFNAVTVYTTDTNHLIRIRQFPFVKQLKSVIRLKSIQPANDKFSLESITDLESGTVTDTTLLRYGKASRQIGMLNGHILHNQGFQGQGMVIAVLDAGFRRVDVNHAFDSLYINSQILGGWDFVNNSPLSFADTEHAHGAQVLSIMAGNLPSELVGTAPKASYYLLRTEDAPTENLVEEDNWIASAEWADSAGADLINSSLGYTTFDIPALNHTYSDMDGNTTRITIAADIAASKGMLVVNSAGNEASIDWHYIGAPADADNILTVGAVDSLGNYAIFSSTGPTFDGRIKPNIVAQGQLTAVVGTDGNIFRGSGTSYSSPVMCGLAACLWQTNRTLPPMIIIETIQQSASRASNPDSLYGYGVPDFGKALFLMLGISPIKLDDESLFRVYPNPFTDHLVIDFYSHDRQEITIEVIAMTGKKLVLEKLEVGYTSINRLDINQFSELPAGMYILRIITQSGHYEQTLIKASN